MDNQDSLIYINKELSCVEEIVKTQSEQNCRKDIFETLGLIKQTHPEHREYIEERFQQMCKDYNKDFFKEIRWDDIAQELRSMNDE